MTLRGGTRNREERKRERQKTQFENALIPVEALLEIDYQTSRDTEREMQELEPC